MLIHPNTHALWLLLLLRACGSDSMKFNLFTKKQFELLTVPQDGDVRLFGSQRPSEGRVEIYHDGKWGTACNDGWDLAEAQVVCRQLHFLGAKAVVTGKDYGKAPERIWLDDINCNGTEDVLTSCFFKDWGVTDCTHKEDVGVICATDMNMTISDAKYSLDHVLFLSEDLGQLFDSGDGCDFQILVQSPAGNTLEDENMEMAGTTICAHKVILSRFSHFSDLQRSSNISIQVSQSCQPHFTPFIRYLYTRKLDVTFSSARCLHWMASEFGVKQLIKDIGLLFVKLIPEDVSFRTQVSLYEYAVETRDVVLQENCIQYLAWNYQDLTRSPAWSHLSAELLGTLLRRSELVVPDESFLLRSVESWIAQKGNLTSLETQAKLLSYIRFPMISAENLYGLEFNSTLYNTHKNLFRDNIIKALQFHVLLFSRLKSKPTFNAEDKDYQPRIYTAKPWSVVINPRKPPSNPVQLGYQHLNQYNSYSTGSSHRAKTFKTPAHNSMIFKEKEIRWEADLFTAQYECAFRGIMCDSVPVARLISQNTLSQFQSSILFNNLLLVTCEDKHISQVQEFKLNMVYISPNGTPAVSYPCPDNQYTYQFVVRPKYI